MTLKYESELLFDLMKRDGDVAPSDVLPYESELKEKYLNQVVGAYPKLQDYRPEWLNYNLYHHLPSDFPTESVTNVTSASFNNVVPYAYRSAILKGNTLVNLVINGLDVVTSSTANTKISRITLDSSKTYTIICEVEQTPQLNIRYWYTDGTYGNDIAFFARDTITGRFISKIPFDMANSTKNLDNISLYIPNPVRGDLVKNIVILEGDYTNEYIPYFTGMQSVKMPVLTTTGKNLVVKPQYGYVANGVINTGVKDWINSDYVYVKGLKEVVGSTSSSITGATNIATYDKNKQLLRALNGHSEATLNDDEYYVIFSKRKLDNTEFTSEELLNSQMQLEVGSVATTYERYKSIILTVNEDVELRGIGEVKDTLNLMTGELTQRIGEIVLDGSEDWNEYTLHGIDGYTAFITTIPSLNNLYHGTDKIFISVDFPVGTWEDYTNNLIPELVWNHDPNKIGIRVKSEKASAVKEIKEFLSTNNIRINYELVTESIKTVDLTCINEQGENETLRPIEGTMHVNTSSRTLLPLLDMSVPVEATSQNLMSFANIVEEE